MIKDNSKQIKYDKTNKLFVISQVLRNRIHND